MVIIEESLFGSADIPLRHARICHDTYTRELSPGNVSVVSGGESTDSVLDAVLRPETFEYYMPDQNTWEIEISWTDAQDVDYVAIGGHTAGTAGATVSVDVGGANVGSASPSSDRPLIWLFEERSVTSIKISGDQACRIAVVYFGKALAMYRPIFSGVTPISMARQTTRRGSVSIGGQLLGQDIVRQGVQFSLSWRHLPGEWYRDNVEPFALDARRYPVFVAWRPSEYPLETAYAWVDGDIQPSNMGIRDLMEVSVNFEGIGANE